MSTRIELYERYSKDGEYTAEWWEENMPKGAKFNPTYYYRRTNPRIEDIERIIEIEGNKVECLVKFYTGEVWTVKANFDDLSILFNDLENQRQDEIEN